jgi:hypothetical protein
VRYDRDVNFGGTQGVVVDLEAGTAIDGFGDTDTLINIQRVRGSQFDDILIGSSTQDNVLRGGGGADTFVYLGGNDVIADFQIGLDILDLSRLLLDEADLSAVFASAVDVGGGTRLNFSDGNSLTFAGLSVEQVQGLGPDGRVVNLQTGLSYKTLAGAVDAALAGETLLLKAGIFDESVVIDKELALVGARGWRIEGGQPVIESQTRDSFFNIDTGSFVETFNATGRGGESQILGTLTVASDSVTLDSLFLGGFDRDTSVAPLKWDGEISNFTLTGSLLTGYEASAAPKFTGSAASASGGWLISDNLIGGVVSGTGGAMYLTGLGDPGSASAVAGNVFWRPGAGHLYLESVENLTVEENFFYHGLHAGGANFDGAADLFPDQQGYGYGGGGYGGGGYGNNGSGEIFFGRNFWLEMKGINSDIRILNNDGAFNSGGIQLFARQEVHSSVTS